MFLSYDITGVFWSPIVFGCAGYLCFFYTKEPTLEEGEELLVLADGKQANVSVVIGTGQNASHKLFLTNQTIQIDGPKVNVALPYSSIQSVSKDTHLKLNMALRLVTHDNQDVKLAFGMGRAKKRDLFLAAIQAKSYEASQVAAPPPLPGGGSDQIG